MAQIERRLDRVGDPPPLAPNLPKDRIRILLVTARPYEGDVAYRSISRPLVELIARLDLPAEVHVLRPPTLARLREHLRERPHAYHVLHFDGHGTYQAAPAEAASLSPAAPAHTFQGPEGLLVFEDEQGGPASVGAEQLAPLLREFAVPVVVLNACRSGMLDAGAEDAFASVAGALLQSGTRSVVAMAYTVYASAAQRFLPAFYRRLFETGRVAEGVRAGRQELLADPGRVCARGRFALRDWLVPVLYQQEDVPLPLGGWLGSAAVSPGQGAGEMSETGAGEIRGPVELGGEEGLYGFVGRDGPLLRLERALRRRPVALVVHGLGGVGKTTLARGFVEWLRDTGGLGAGCLWFDFRDIRSAEYVLNRAGELLFGPDFAVLEPGEKIKSLAGALRKVPLLQVWDNFEVAAGIAGSAVEPNLAVGDRATLRELLRQMRGGVGKVLVTSRSEDAWLGEERFPVSLGGLAGEERWELCERILTDLGGRVDRDDPELVALMDLLGGHPFAMRVVLPQLAAGKTAAEVARELREGIAEFRGVGEERARFYATLRLAETSLPAELKPLLVPLAFHEGYVQAEILEWMARETDPAWGRERIDAFLEALAAAGLLRRLRLGPFLYEMHPALAGFLRATALSAAGAERDRWARSFVEVLAILADALAPRPLHEQRGAFQTHGASFQSALVEAERLGMDLHRAALLQALGVFAQNVHRLGEAADRYARLAEVERRRQNEEGEAAACHQLGRIAEERRDWEGAEGWYRKSLEINERLGNEPGAAYTYHQLGNIAAKYRDWEGAESWYRKSLEIKERLGNEPGAASTYHQLGRIAEACRDWKRAESWYRKSLEIKERLGDESGAAITYHQLGNVAQARRDWDGAESWYRKSLEIKERLSDEPGAASTYHQLGMIAQERRDWEGAEGWYRKSLEISERLGNEPSAAITYHQLGLVAGERRDWEVAEGWYGKSLEVEERLGNEPGAAIAYHQLGIVAQERGDWDGAEGWYRRSLEIKERLGIEPGAAITHHQLGNVAQAQRDWDGAESWYRKSLEIKERLGDEPGAAITYHQLGNVAQERRDWDGAEGWYRKSLEISERLGIKTSAAGSYGQLGILWGLTERYQESGAWLLRSLRAHLEIGDEEGAQRAAVNFSIVYRRADPQARARLRWMWEEAGLGQLPANLDPTPESSPSA